ncbi:MAG: GHKL domain-containing protein [Clostridia bacterium]|nr:GHKL domain-containing protein [Clostridia bacterium]
MVELGDTAGSIANLAFGLIGIWMAHSLYWTPRKKWQAILTWVLILIGCAVGATVLQILLPQVPYVRLSMCVGFSGIFAYLYLFPDIPVQQRIFTYFMVDTSMTLLVLAARTTSVLLIPAHLMDSDRMFLALYVPLTAGFLIFFHRWLKGVILSALQVFRTHLTSLTVFAAAGYITLLLIADPWAPWPMPDLRTAAARYGLCVFVVVGYLLAFRTLTTLRHQDDAEENTRRLSDQVALTEQYYDKLVEQIEQLRIRDHDLRHHMSVLSGLCTQGSPDEVRDYVSGMVSELPRSSFSHYCDDGALNALLNHYDALCAREQIRFSCQLHLPRTGSLAPLHLCVIFGNALQNALEASLRVSPPESRFIELKAAPDGGRLAISIVNRFNGTILAGKDGQLRSSKSEPGHGLGLSSIRETARRYGGWCGTLCADDRFQLMVTLKIPI